MNRDRTAYHPLVLYFILWLVVVLFSWMDSVYELITLSPSSNGEMGHTVVQNLLSAESVRWLVRNVIPNFLQSPVGEALLVLTALGVIDRSGLLSLLFGFVRRRKSSVKQRRAFIISLFSFLLIVAVLSLSIIRPWGILLGVTGSLSQSPFAHGLLFLVAFVLSVTGIVYGSLSGEFRSTGDVVEGLTHYLSLYASFFLTLFMASQLVACIRYSQLNVMLGIGEESFEYIAQAIYWLPLLYLFFLHHRQTVTGMRS